MKSFDPGLMLELLETFDVNATAGVPTMMIALLEHPDFATRDLSNLSNIVVAGSAVPAELVLRCEKELGVSLMIGFGQTECSPGASLTLPGDSTADKANTVGGPMPNVEIKIIDPEAGATQPINTLGEFCVRGYNVMLGYFNMDEATAKTLDKDQWLHTGDLCSMDDRGYCTFEGRLKDMIVRGGENIYPREIEALLFEHPTVGEVAVVGLPDDKMGEIVAAFIRPAPGQNADRETLFSYLREHLSPQKTPTRWFRVDEFPLTGPGKIQKTELKTQWQAGEFLEL